MPSTGDNDWFLVYGVVACRQNRRDSPARVGNGRLQSMEAWAVTKKKMECLFSGDAPCVATAQRRTNPEESLLLMPSRVTSL